MTYFEGYKICKKMMCERDSFIKLAYNEMFIHKAYDEPLINLLTFENLQLY